MGGGGGGGVFFPKEVKKGLDLFDMERGVWGESVDIAGCAVF